MTTAIVTTPRDPQQCFSGFLSLFERLHGQLTLTVIYAPLHDKLGLWDSDTRTVTVNEAACLEDQTWFLNQVWQLVTIGPSAIDPAATREPRLALVPTPLRLMSRLA